MMEETISAKHVCFRCVSFTRYYTKGAGRFIRTKCGFCRTTKQIVPSQGDCEKWQPGFRTYLPSRADTTRILAQLLSQLTEIRQILQEEQDETV